MPFTLSNTKKGGKRRGESLLYYMMSAHHGKNDHRIESPSIFSSPLLRLSFFVSLVSVSVHPAGKSAFVYVCAVWLLYCMKCKKEKRGDRECHKSLYGADGGISEVTPDRFDIVLN
jgi:hypothetical protein